ncbi:MAG: hypothetical protein WAW37_09135 [Syntrophobacteraceae bacterium]
MEARPHKAGAILLLLWLMLISQACISEVKPVFKAVPADIPARIAAQQKQIDQGLAAQDFSPNAARKLQENLDRIKEKYSQVQAKGGPDAKETEALARMLNANADRVLQAMETHRKALNGKGAGPSF